MGPPVGDSVGREVGNPVGRKLGLELGVVEGASDHNPVGCNDGNMVAVSPPGCPEGPIEGLPCPVGPSVLGELVSIGKQMTLQS